MRQSLGLSGALAPLALFVAACASHSPTATPGGDQDTLSSTVPSQGSSATLDVGNWNVEWFGDGSNGPDNEPLQLQNVRAVMAGADMDIWGLEEVVSASQFQQLVSQLPGYTGLLANDPAVVDGPRYYDDFDNTEQKVALVWKSSVATLLGARVILTDNDYDFAGRPPVQFELRVTLNGSTEDIIVIVLHAKAGAESESWDRRNAASPALKTYLGDTYPAGKVWVIGDFNDDVDHSITPGHTSPYRNFVMDPADYAFPTKDLSDQGTSSTVGFSDVIDHQLNTNEAYATYVSGSAQAFRADQYISGYGTNTSDHYPVLVSYVFGGGGG